MRTALAFVVGGALGAAFGFAVGIFVYPYVFLADIVATDSRPSSATQTLVATGKFIHANPTDPIHYGKGAVTLYRDVLHLEQDFEVGPGPKYHVYLVPDSSVTTKTDVAQTAFVDLGRLRAFKGSQNYAIPHGTNLRKYGSVVIWCEQFGVLISPATLSFD
jgi:hypothetical protein